MGEQSIHRWIVRVDGFASRPNSDEVREATWHRLENVDVDATQRQLIWDDGKRLCIDESVQRILGDNPDFPVELIETHLIAWLEMEFVPKTYSQEQIDELVPVQKRLYLTRRARNSRRARS